MRCGGLVQAVGGARGGPVAAAGGELAPAPASPAATIREIAVRTAGAAIPTGSSSRTSAATGAWSPRVRRWSPYTSNRAERARMRRESASRVPSARRHGADGDLLVAHDRAAWGIMVAHTACGVARDPRPLVQQRGRGARMAAMKPRTGDGPLEVTKEGRGIVMRVPLEGGGRLVVELNAEEAGALGDALKDVVG